MRSDESLATVLLVGRLLSDGVEPLKASDFWRLCESVGEPSRLLGAGDGQLLSEFGLEADTARRIVALLDRATGMAFELERLGQTGISVLTPFDEDYPGRFAERLGPHDVRTYAWQYVGVSARRGVLPGRSCATWERGATAR